MSEPTPVELFSTRMQAAMQARGIRQALLAHQLNTSPATVNRWYNGGNLPDGASGTLLADRLGVPRDWLLKGANPAELPARHPLRALRERAGLTVHELATATGFPAASLHAVELGTPACDRLLAALLQALPGITPEDLAARPPGVDSLEAAADSADPGSPRPGGGSRPRYTPLLTWAQASHHSPDTPAERTDTLGILPLEIEDTRAFAVVLEGDAMSPNLMPGDRLLVAPSWPPRAGDTVILRTTDGDVFCKLYTRSTQGKLHLASINKDHPPIELTPAEIAWMYPVAQVTKTLRRR